MEIPDSLSDMDSIPESISLTGSEAFAVDLEATGDDLNRDLLALSESLERFNNALTLASVEDP